MRKRMIAVMVAVIVLQFIMVPVSVIGQILPGVRTVSIVGHRPGFDGSGNAIQRYLLIDVSNGDIEGDGIQDFEPLDPVGILLLLPGGEGRLFLTAGTRNTASTNFVARTRYHFAAEGFIVAVMDAASDFLDHNHARIEDPPGSGFIHGSGLEGHRLPNRVHGEKYKQDLKAVIGDLRQKYPGLPLWAVGTSRGTISAAVAATELADPPDGIVLTSSLTGPSRIGDLSPNNIDLGAVNVPTLIVTNQNDQCPRTRPEDSKRLKKRFTGSPRVQVLIFNGGSAPLTDACDPLAGHGFFGIEQKVIESITRWIKHAEK